MFGYYGFDVPDRTIAALPHDGFDVDRVLSEAPEWALRHGIIPRDLPRLASARFAPDPARALPAAERLQTRPPWPWILESALP